MQNSEEMQADDNDQRNTGEPQNDIASHASGLLKGKSAEKRAR